MSRLVAGMYIDGDPLRPYVELDEAALLRALALAMSEAQAKLCLEVLREILISAARRQ